MAALERITVYPIKGLDGIELDAVEVLDGGTLQHDREYALFDDAGDVINGKRTASVHELSTDFDPESGTFHITTDGGDSHRFDLKAESEETAEWFSAFFDQDLTLERDTSLGYVDRREMGPSVISTATLEEVASWFEEMTVDGARRRLRPNVEISGVPPFWEDRFVGAGAPTFEVGSVEFEGVSPCGRCVVPGRDPDTGEPTPEFRERFIQNRTETFPEWADEDAFDHLFTLMIITSVPESDRGETLRVGDTVRTTDQPS